MMAQVTYIRIFFSLTSFMHFWYYPLHFNLILSGIIMYIYICILDVKRSKDAGPLYLTS